ncbi:hypothetical protein J6590_001526 [Homalodisca vitripennis]|nr:hypothetical protein J6590_001526 [Homalodisca vitripennis]
MKVRVSACSRGFQPPNSAAPTHNTGRVTHPARPSCRCLFVLQKNIAVIRGGEAEVLPYRFVSVSNN